MNVETSFKTYGVGIWYVKVNDINILCIGIIITLTFKWED